MPRLLNSGLSDSQVLDFTRANFADLYAAVKAQGLTGAPRYLDAWLSSDQSRAATQANFTDLYTLLGRAGTSGLVIADPDFFASDIDTSGTYGIGTNPTAFYDATGNKTWMFHESWRGSDSKRVSRCLVYDHSAATLSASADAFNSDMVDDDHGVPAGCMDASGYVHAFGGAHGASTGEVYASTSTARDPTTFTARTRITSSAASSGFAYPHPHVVSGVLYLFMRRTTTANTSFPLVLKKSTAGLGTSGGVTAWSTDEVLVDLDSGAGAGGRVYMGQSQLAPNGTDIWIPFVRADTGDTYRQNFYIIIYNTLDGSKRKVAGTITRAAGTTIDYNDANGNFRIVDHQTPVLYSNGGALVFDSAGNAHILSAHSATWNDVAVSNGDLFHMMWNGSSWSSPVTIGTLGQRYDGMALTTDGGTGVIASWISKGTRLRGGSIVQATRTSGGVWSATQTVKSENGLYSLNSPAPVQNGVMADLAFTFGEFQQPPAQGNTGGPVAWDAAGGNLRFHGVKASGALVSVPWALQTETQAFITAMQVAPNKTWTKIYDELVKALKNANAFSALCDAMFPICAHDQQAGLINLVDATKLLTVNGGMTWQAIPGQTASTWKGNGSTGYLLAPYTALTTPGMKYAAASLHMGIFNLTEGAANPGDCGTTGSSNGTETYIICREVAGTYAMKTGTSAKYTATVASALGSSIIRRNGASAEAAWRDGGGGADSNQYNGGAIATTAAASTGVPNAPFCAYRVVTTYSSRQLAFFHFGQSVAAKQQGIMVQAFRRYLIDAGALAAIV